MRIAAALRLVLVVAAFCLPAVARAQDDDSAVDIDNPAPITDPVDMDEPADMVNPAPIDNPAPMDNPAPINSDGLSGSSCSCPDKPCDNGSAEGCRITCPAGGVGGAVCECTAFCDGDGNPAGRNLCRCQ